MLCVVAAVDHKYVELVLGKAPNVLPQIVAVFGVRDAVPLTVIITGLEVPAFTPQ